MIFCKQNQIIYSKLTDEEKLWLLKIMDKSKKDWCPSGERKNSHWQYERHIEAISEQHTIIIILKKSGVFLELFWKFWYNHHEFLLGLIVIYCLFLKS